MSFDFAIPMCKEELLNRTGVNQYVVDEVLSIRQLQNALREYSSARRSQGPLAIIQHFDTFYSILKQLSQVDNEVKEDAWESIIKSVSSHANLLPNMLDEASIEHHSKMEHLNTLKMNCYLLCQFIEIFEADATKPSVTVNAKGKGKKKKAADMSWDWEGERERAMQAMSQLLQLNIHRLWDPPVVEEEFVNLVTSCCYKLLENPTISRVSSKPTRDAICQILGMMIKKHNHSLSASLKIVQLLQHFEHLISPLAQAVQMFATEFGVKTVVSEIMREIGRIDAQDLVKDASGTRGYSGFLVELAERIPAIMLPSISVILGHLDGESYMMRNGVVGVMGEIVMKVLSKEDLDDKLKATRDQFLDKLEDHIHDVHAFTRSKVLQIWLNIVKEKALPLPRQQHVVELVIGRLQDKSSSVRKNAIQLVTALLRSNPFAAKLSLEELKTNYEKEKEKLHEMEPEETLPAVPNDLMIQEEWQKVESAIEVAIKAVMEASDEEEDEDNAPKIGEGETIDNAMECIYNNITSEEYKKAVQLTQMAKEQWPEHDLFNPSNVNVQGDDSDVESDEAVGTEPWKCLQCLKSIFLGMAELPKADQNQNEDKDKSKQTEQEANELAKQQVLVQYLKDCMIFTGQVQQAIPVICQLLGSKNTTDILEAMEFFVTAFEFGVSNSMLGIRRMLALIWSKEQSVKDSLVVAYKRLYLSPVGGTARQQSLAIVKNLTALTYGATLGDLTSLEEMVCEFAKSEDIDSGVIKMLWERFAKKVPNTSDEESRGALLLLGMAAGHEENIIKSNVDVLVSEGLGERGKNDFQLAKDTCIALLKLGGTKKAKAGSFVEPFRFPQDHDIFTRLADILVAGVSNLESPFWVPMGEQAINVIYKLAEHPDVIATDIVMRLIKEIKGTSESGVSSQENMELDTINESQELNTNNPERASLSPTEFNCPSGILTRLLSLAGHIALRHLVHLDVAVFGELKRRNAIHEEEKNNKKMKVNYSASATPMNKAKDSANGETIDEEMGLAGATADDAEAEYIRRVCEHDIVTGSNLLAVLKPLIVTVCNNQVKYPDPELRTAATLALAKFMMVSSEFCDSHLQLLFTVLEKSPNPAIRANTIIALGDLTFRFPNLIEPWTSNLYARLRDDSPMVRKNTLMVLTHLILNDMVKVKGQISELATCIVDEDTRISNLAKLFFLELAKKGNAVYNIMPDVISRLSDPDVGVAEDNFRIIMKYLFSFIQKDRQCESLVEKLCHRFRATRVDRQWRDLSFCLSMLSYNERSIRKLQENFACFGDKLADDEVYNCFMIVINGAKKFAKTEIKAMVDEFEERVTKCHNKGMDDEEATQKASKASNAAKNRRKTPTKTPGRKAKGKTPARRKATVDTESEEDDDVIHPARRGKNAAPKPKPKLSFSDSEDSEIELFDLDKSSSQQQLKGESDTSSDSENINPNIEPDSPPPPIRKSRTALKSKSSTSKTPIKPSNTRKRAAKT
ncbi:unnamed protein product [Owenia fusiformis]|uniref:Condensin complex subunit 1 n=1 Tax=Owenia fusiformis TaxID=6347 RepID=A0A8S4N1C7_OWEFU|nr:unnamed protein product [Owenia fusiformis]